MSWDVFCQAFTIFHLGILASALIFFLLSCIVVAFRELVGFIKKVKRFSKEFEAYKLDYLRKDRETYSKLSDLQKQICDLQKGKK